MAGHSKWNNIKRRKGAQDAKRGKIFTKLGREIKIAVKEGGPDADSNVKLANVLAKARTANMPNDTINNAIKSASASQDTDKFEEVIYEGYAPKGVAIIVITTTDNRNRTVGEVRFAFEKSGGSLGTPGSVLYNFDKKGVLAVEKEDLAYSEDEMMMLALDAGAEDFNVHDEIYEILTDYQEFAKVREVLEENGIKFLVSEIQMVPKSLIELNEEEAEKFEVMIDRLEDLDDVQNVYHNADI